MWNKTNIYVTPNPMRYGREQMIQEGKGRAMSSECQSVPTPPLLSRERSPRAAPWVGPLLWLCGPALGIMKDVCTWL